MSKQSSNANSQSDRREADYREYCQEVSRQIDECLLLFNRIETSPADSRSNRKAVIEHCRSYSIRERTFWYYLACYTERGSFNLTDRPDALFQIWDKFLREQIPALIPQIPHRAFAECKKLLCFTSSLLDRMSYLCDWLVNSFLEKAIEHNHSHVDDKTLLDEEFFNLCEKKVINAICAMQRSIGNELEDEKF